MHGVGTTQGQVPPRQKGMLRNTLLNNRLRSMLLSQRRERDSNPCYGYKPVERFSKPSPSAARPSLQRRSPVRWGTLSGSLKKTRRQGPWFRSGPAQNTGRRRNRLRLNGKIAGGTPAPQGSPGFLGTLFGVDDLARGQGCGLWIGDCEDKGGSQGREHCRVMRGATLRGHTRLSLFFIWQLIDQRHQLVCGADQAVEEIQ